MATDYSFAHVCTAKWKGHNNADIDTGLTSLQIFTEVRDSWPAACARSNS